MRGGGVVAAAFEEESVEAAASGAVLEGDTLALDAADGGSGWVTGRGSPPAQPSDVAASSAQTRKPWATRIARAGYLKPDADVSPCPSMTVADRGATDASDDRADPPSPTPDGPTTTAAPGAMRPAPIDPAGYPRFFTRGKKRPRAIAWFGVRSFSGHLRHLISSAIASENIDSRDWMHADPPEKLVEQLVRLLGRDDGEDTETAPTTLTEGLGRDAWLDFIADTGDDSSVAEAVGKLLARPYELPDPERAGAFLHGPRGDVLIHGGDLAYPVGTADEIHDRLIVPFNRALVEQRDGRQRALLGIPGNHDWYDGLDGFARTFRRRIGELSADYVPPSLQKDRASRFEHVVEFVEQFVSGGKVQKRKTLLFDGYVPMQQASYFALPLAPGVELWACDRQLGTVDFRQRRYFANRRLESPKSALFVLLPDPVYAYLQPSPTGVGVMQALELDPEGPHRLYLSGDIHHYQRRAVGRALHVIAGGGGAFLHPARVAREGMQPPQAEWPDVRTSRRLLAQVPWQIAAGRSGFLPHALLLTFFAPAIDLGLRIGGTEHAVIVGSLVAGFIAGLGCALIGGLLRSRSWRTALLALFTGACIGFIPVFWSSAVAWLLARVGTVVDVKVYSTITAVGAVFYGTLLYGAFLAALTWLGLENTQAFTALGHPGFKHFLRMRVRRDGSAIDVWCLGLVSPLRPDEPPVLVDRFTWRPGAASAASEPRPR